MVITPTLLSEKLAEQRYFTSADLARKLMAALQTRPIAGAFLFGPPGAGKSALPEALAGALERPLLAQQLFPGSREDDLLLKFVPDASSPSGVAAAEGVMLEAARRSQNESVIVLLDEWDKSRPSADAFLLDFLQTGRIRFNGCITRANLRNIALFITSNEERDIAEPLLRRLPRIDIPLPSAALVRQALAEYAEHPQFEAVIALYERAKRAQLRKPVTIQELRQLLDAITALGPLADWNELVYQFVTKNPEDHAALKEVERVPLTPEPAPATNWTLDPDAYQVTAPAESPAPFTPRLPRRDYQAPAERPMLQGVGGVLKNDPANPLAYDYVARRDLEAGKLGPSRDQLYHGRVIQVDGAEYVILREPLPFNKVNIERLNKGLEGEVVFYSEPVSFTTFKAWLKSQRNIALINAYSADAIAGRLFSTEFHYDIRFKRFELIISPKQFETLLGYYNVFLMPTLKIPGRRTRTGEGVQFVPLGQGLRARLRVTRCPHLGVGGAAYVEVKANLDLPTRPNGTRLPSYVVFNNHLTLCNLPLTDFWSNLVHDDEGSWQTVERRFGGLTWEEAENQAWNYLHEQIVQLILALRKRRAVFGEGYHAA